MGETGKGSRESRVESREQRRLIAEAADAPIRRFLPSLYLIADRATCASGSMEAVLERALDAGVRFVQLREKDLQPDALRRLAEGVLRLTGACGAKLLINTHAEVAAEIGADGVHLPAAGPDARAIRKRFGRRLLVGCSTHNLEELERAAEGGADFVTYSPIYTPGSKPGYGLEVGLDGLRSAAGAADVPVFALGGITPERTLDCRSAGASGVAVMSGILAAEDAAAAVKAYLAAWGGDRCPNPFAKGIDRRGRGERRG